MKNSDRISVIVPARNSHLTIQQTLESILNQTLKPFEIIVVCNKFDSTLKPLQIYKTNKLIKVIQIKEDKKYIRDAHLKRWIGANASKGDYIFFVDSKAILQSDALNRSIKLIKKYKVQAVAGIAQSWIDQKHLFIAKIQDKALIKNNPSFPKIGFLTKDNFGKSESLPVTTALIISKNAFSLIKDDFGLNYSKIASTYDDYITAWLLVEKGVKILITNSVVSYHKHRLNFKDYVLQISRSGQSAAIMVNQFPICPFGKRRLFQVILFYLCILIFFVTLLSSILFFGLTALLFYSFMITLIFLILGIINLFQEKDLSCLFIPPFTFYLIGVFCFHFMKWYVNGENLNGEMKKYLQIG